jgi:hypothetical protein
MSEICENKQNFLKNHADTIAIMGLNLAIAGILIALYISNVSNISAVNARMDTANARFDQMHALIYQEMKDFHGRLCAIEERNKK